MKNFRQLCFSIVLIMVLVAPALGGETLTPPGETHTPPAVLGETNSPPVAPGETGTPPALGFLIYLVQTWL
jgi:hypothetical protein